MLHFKNLSSGVSHWTYKLPIFPIGFPGTCFLTFLEMWSAVWLISDFASTPFALKSQLGILPLPLLAIYVRLMIISRMKSMFSFTACTLRWFLSAGSVDSYFHRQGRMRLLSYTRKTTDSFFQPWTYFTLWIGEQSYFLTEGLFSCNFVILLERKSQFRRADYRHRAKRKYSHQEPVSGQACNPLDPHWFFLCF